MEPQKPEPRIWAIVTITVAIIGCLGLLGQSFITILPDLLETSETTSSPPQPTVTPVVPSPTVLPSNTIQGLNARLLGQDGSDLAVSGCHDGSGSKGIIDNHITLSGVENTEDIERIDIQYGDLDHWRYPCQLPIWELVVSESTEGVLELYFEPEGSKSQVVTFLISLTYQDGSVIQTTVVGNSGFGR